MVDIVHGSIQFYWALRLNPKTLTSNTKRNWARACSRFGVLVAADVVGTIVLEPNLQNVTILGLLVVIRTFLSWSLVVEIEGSWPWQRNKSVAGRASRAEG